MIFESHSQLFGMVGWVHHHPEASVFNKLGVRLKNQDISTGLCVIELDKTLVRIFMIILRSENRQDKLMVHVFTSICDKLLYPSSQLTGLMCFRISSHCSASADNLNCHVAVYTIRFPPLSSVHLTMWRHTRVLHGSYFANLHPPVPVELKTASDSFRDSSTNYIPHLNDDVRTRSKIRRTQFLKMKVSQRGEWELWEGASTREWAHMK